MSLDYDFWLTPAEGDALGFNKCPTKDVPEERGTAQFRKDQFDSTPTVGDQSLTGWWTRGQLSFHKGGGVTYYEVSEGETVLDRYISAENVDPFTPGEVNLSRELNEISTSGFGFVDCVHVQHYTNGNRIVGRGDDGKAYHVTTGTPFSSQTVTQITTTGSADVVSVASSRFRVYLAIGQNIEVWYPGAATSTVLWTGSLGGWNIVALWYAKQRLWAVDGNGNWYTLDTAGGTFATADSKFKIKDYGWLVATDQTWSLVESPGPVYISAFNEVYSVSVTYDEGSLLPTINAPILAAEIPNNEVIRCLGWALGTLMMATRTGARFAVPDSDGGLAYGPQVAPLFNFGGTKRIAASGTKMCTGTFLYEESGVYSYDLGNVVDGLQPAHTLEYTLPGTVINATGCLTTLGGLVTWNSGDRKLYRVSSTNYASSGSLKTGYHRFGTLDPKWFRSVLVRAAGDGGSIDVYRIDPDGSSFTQTLLGSIDLSGEETSADLDLGPDVPSERVGIKFVLKRDPSDSTKAPQLLGYQLKALPLPRRQRLIRIPMMLFDYETDGRTRTRRGKQGDAWARLAALEALEESNAVVAFEDKETGETGNAYIEAVEVRRTASVAQGGTSDGFGGLLILTLRKL